MQTWILYYMERLRDRMRIGHCSMAAAITAELGNMDTPSLLKLRAAALDLHRIVELELGGRAEVEL